MGVHSKIETPAPGLSQSEKVVDNEADDVGKQRIEALLVLEAEVRKCTTITQLQYLVANETAKLIPSRQTILLHGYKSFSIIAISSLATLDKTSPTLRWLQEALNTLSFANREDDSIAPDTPCAGYAELSETSAPGKTWPFKQVLQVKFSLKQNVGMAKLVLLSERGFEEADLAMARRLSDTYSHAWNALVRAPVKLAGLMTKKTSLLVTCLLVLAMFLPVRMTVLAPVEIVARNPIVVAAPLTGVVGSVDVNPNDSVSSGDLLFTFVSTDLDNEYKIAQQIVHVARSRFLRASQDAFGEGLGRREMAELNSELNLANAKLDYAKSRLEQSWIKAIGEGVILFSDKDDWIGKPVSAGEKIMRIADPQNIEYLINLPIAESIILEDGDEVRIFLDVDPLNPVAAKIVTRSYQAKPDAMNNFSFQLIARSQGEQVSRTGIANRIGVRGTSQIFGNKVPLGLYLFRKPLSAFRQFVGL